MYETNKQQVFLDLRLEFDLTGIVQIELKYQTVLDLIAFLGGFSKGLSMFLLIMVFPFREIHYYRKLINSMFSVCTTADQISTAFDLIQDELKSSTIKDLENQQDKDNHQQGKTNQDQNIYGLGKLDPNIQRNIIDTPFIKFNPDL